MNKKDSSNSETSSRISLSEMSRRAPRILQRGDSLLLEEGAAPTLNDLASALQFALGDGRIWLNDERMVLVQTKVLGALQAQMIRDSGMDHTRRACMRIGWQEGVQHAELIKTRFAQHDLTAALAAGPRVHTLEGFAKVVTKRFEFDAKRKTYLGEFHWIDSVEGTQHFKNFGVCDCPACWLQVGVPSGYTTALLGFPVIFREIECVAQGAARCIVIGKDVESWGGDVPELEIFGLSRDGARRTEPWNPAQAMPLLGTSTVDQAETIIGHSAHIQRTKRLLDKASPFSETVMLIGGPGTGKEFFARYLHSHGATPKGTFVSVNCGALTEGQPTLQDELFGPEGYLQKAKGGTLFLNDFLSLGVGLQAKLAAFLHEDLNRQQKTRIIAATGLSPLEAIAKGQFRTDLHNLLSILPIEVPALRDRRDDIPALIAHFLSVHRKRHRKMIEGLTGAAYDLLLLYDYPGNVRELSNLIERGIIFAEPGGFVDIHHMFTSLEKLPELAKSTKPHLRATTVTGSNSQDTLEALEIELLRAALVEADWNVSEAARNLGLSRAKLDYRIKKFGLRPPSS